MFKQHRTHTYTHTYQPPCVFTMIINNSNNIITPPFLHTCQNLQRDVLCYDHLVRPISIPVLSLLSQPSSS
eukprot:m.106921 g.106921  ORF g.106921 m.106921 type:complete len:71 (-) comp10606_c0_seq1:581-793(-)